MLKPDVEWDGYPETITYCSKTNMTM